MSFQQREVVYAALFGLIQNALLASPTPAATVTRAVKHYSNVDAAEMPYVGQLQKNEMHARKRGLDDKITLEAVLLIYTQALQDGTPASTAINNILDTIGGVLSNSPIGNNQNLGLPGVVEHAWIEGKVEIYEGILVNTSIAIVPIHILVTG